MCIVMVRLKGTCTSVKHVYSTYFEMAWIFFWQVCTPKLRPHTRSEVFLIIFLFIIFFLIIFLARTKGSSLYAVLVRSTVVNPSLSVLISSSQTHWQRKELPSMDRRLAPISPLWNHSMSRAHFFSSWASKRTPQFWYVLFPSCFFCKMWIHWSHTLGT